MGSSHKAGILLASILLIGIAARAAEPELKHLYPAAGAQGTNIAVTCGSKQSSWPPQVWVDAPGIIFTATPIVGTFNVEIAPDALPGPHLVRFFNEDGASAPRFFIVSRTAEPKDIEPNDDFKSPQSLSSLPKTVNGRLDRNGDVDSFAVTLRRGETLVAWLEAYVLASTFDGMIRIVDSDGIQSAFNHDGSTLDPFLTWKVPKDGTYIIQIMGFAHPATSSVQFTGGEGCVYRLHLTTGPILHHTLPLAAQRGKKTSLQLVGWNLVSSNVELDGSAYSQKATFATLPFSGITTEQTIALSNVSEILENEPNDAVNAAQSMDLPAAVTGRIQQANDEDRFTFRAIKQRTYDLKVTGAKAGSPLDAWLKVENKEGKELARNDDAGSRDPKLTWTAPADDIFTVALGDLTHRGDPNFIYRLEVTEASPSVTATVSSHALTLQQGKSNTLKVSVKPVNGFARKLQLSARDLPEGVTAEILDVPEKGGDVTLKLTADAGTKVGGKAFRGVLREPETGFEHPILYFMTATSEDNGVPQGYSDLVIDSTEQLWLTILPAPPEPVTQTAENPKVTPP